MNKLLLFILTFFCLHTYSQSKREIIYGKVLDSTQTISNAHIININTSQGTASDEKGAFKIYAKENDSLRITSIGYKTKIVILKPTNFGIAKNEILLEKTIYELDEIFVKNHNLTGSLELDTKKTPKDTVGELVRNMVKSIQNLDYNAIINMPIGKDEIHLAKVKAPGNPISLSGAGGSVGIPDYQAIKKRELRKKITEKKEFPNKLLNQLGSHFFYSELKIPKDKYYHFITYCSYNNKVKELFKSKKILELIQLLQKESIAYLKIVKENK